MTLSLCDCGCGESVDYRRLATDVEYMVRWYWNKALAPKQKEFLQSCIDNMHTVFISCRQGGKTECQGLNIIRRLVFGKKVKIIIYAPTFHQALGVVYERVKVLFKAARHNLLENEVMGDGKEMRAGGITHMNNGNILKTYTAAPDSKLRGEDPTDTVIDETQHIGNKMYRSDILMSGAAIKDLSASDFDEGRRLGLLGDDNRMTEAFNAFLRDRGITTKVYESGTPLGRNHFYDTCYNSTSAHVVTQHWTESWFTDLKKLEQDREDMDLREFEAEYCCVFYTDNAFAFPRDAVLAACEARPKPDFSITPIINKNAIYVGGIDLGQRRDHTVFAILECIGSVRRLVFLYQWDLNTPWDQMIAEIADIYGLWSPRHTYVDRTGPQGTAIYDGHIVNMSENVPTHHYCYVDGYQFTSATVGVMMKQLNLLFERSNLELWDDRQIKKEFMDVEEKRLPSGLASFPKPEKGHDDRVYAVGLAVMAALVYCGDGDQHSIDLAYDASTSDRGAMIGSAKVPKAWSKLGYGRRESGGGSGVVSSGRRAGGPVDKRRRRTVR